MWPLTLDMTRDECRGILRRSELETYSSVVSTFRAQGGLSEAKVRMLRELREVLHISQERHKAEARRVANDERLCTVAELISGPNTGQEWSREGRRNFPFLSRAVPHTALASIANNAQSIASAANNTLPLPAETKRDKTHDQMQFSDQPPIVTTDPVHALMQNPPLLKRSHLNLESNMANVSGPRKKRISESVPLNHTNMRIQQLYHTHSKTPNPTPPVVNLTTNRKNATPKRASKSTAKSTPRANKQRQNTSANNKKSSNTQSQLAVTSSSTVPYGSSLKSHQMIISPEHKSLLGETFPDNTFGWTPLQTINSSVQDDHQLKFDQILQQHQPSFPSTVTPTSPVQVVFTSHVNLPASELPKYQSYANNLITESTPIHWVNDPPEETKQPFIQQSNSEILQPILVPNHVANPQPNNSTRPLKMAIPATSRKPTTTTANIPKTQTSTKQTKAVRRKAQPLDAPLAKIAPHSTANVSAYQSNQLSNADPNSLQISSITNKLPTTGFMSMNLLNASTKLPTQILQTSNIIHAKPMNTTTTTTTIAAASPSSTGSVAAKPKIQVTQQIIVPSPNKPFQSKGNVKLVQSANGSIMLKGTSDIVVPTTTVAMSSLPATAKTSYPKIQLVKGTSANMILMQKVGNPFGTALKDGRPMKFNVVHQPPKVNAAPPVLLYDVTTGKTTGIPTPPSIVKPNLNTNSIHITEDTPVDILPSENLILDGSHDTLVQQQQPSPIISATHIIIDANNTNSVVARPLKGTTIVQQKPIKPVRIQPTVSAELPKRPRIDEVNSTTPNVVPAAIQAIIEPTDWEEQLDQQITKQEAIVVGASAETTSTTSIADDLIEEDGNVGVGVAGYMTSEDTNDDDIIQYEGDSTDYQDEFSLDGVPETSKSLNIDMKKQQSQAQVESSSVSKTFSSHYPITSNNGTVATKPNAIAYDCSQDGDDENTQDGESMMMQMEEFDENGCSQIRNVSLEELVDSGHIILDDS